MEPVIACVGVDVGQRVDPSAFVVAEQTATPGELPVFTIRHLERQPINTSYPTVAARVATLAVNLVQLLRQPPRQQGISVAPSGDRSTAAINLYVTIDATGVGRPVVELITAALKDADLARWRVRPTIEPATFNHGDRLVREGGEWRVGKAHMVSRLQALLQTDRIRLPRTA